MVEVRKLILLPRTPSNQAPRTRHTRHTRDAPRDDSNYDGAGPHQQLLASHPADTVGIEILQLLQQLCVVAHVIRRLVAQANSVTVQLHVGFQRGGEIGKVLAWEGVETQLGEHI